MIKQILKNSLSYRNNNNVGVIYEYLGNNAFTDNELFQLSDFLSQNNLLFEFIIINYKGVKKYYISFYYGEIGWANNYNNYDSKKFYERYNNLINLKPKIEEIPMFEGKIKENTFKLYNLDNEKISDYRKELLKQLNYKKPLVRNKILFDNFSTYVRGMLKGTDYKRYIYNNEFYNNVNYEFNSVEQEIFDVGLKFMTGSKYFIFPFYLKGKEQKSGDFSYQELNFNDVSSSFLDKHTVTEKDSKGRDILAYVYKISLKPTRVSADSKGNKVTVEGQTTKFDLNSVNDSRNMFFEFQNSMFLYTKRPDIQRILKDFNVKLGTKIELIQTDIPKDFNPQYLSHNKFSDAYHIGHIRNLEGILSTLKEYYPDKDRGMYIGKEYFSNNKFKFNFFEMAGIDPEGNLTQNANGLLIGYSGTGKTFTALRLFKENDKDQSIVFDNVDNFAKIYKRIPENERRDVGILEYGNNFPNFVGKITIDNISIKQDILYKILIGVNSDLNSENREMIRALINNYLKSNIGGYFKISLFREFIENKNVQDVFTINNKTLMINKIDGINSILYNILDNDKDFNSELRNNKKIILSYGALLKGPDAEYNFFMMEIILKLVQGYLAYKNSLPDSEVESRYTMMLFDEVHNVIDKTTTLDNIFKNFVKEVRNYKSNIILITQSYNDLPSYITSELNFAIILDPKNWDLYRNDVGSIPTKDKSQEEVENMRKLDIVFKNFEAPLNKIIEEYQRDAKLFEDGTITSEEALRFCVFGFRYTSSFYILNTRL